MLWEKQHFNFNSLVWYILHNKFYITDIIFRKASPSPYIFLENSLCSHYHDLVIDVDKVITQNSSKIIWKSYKY